MAGSAGSAGLVVRRAEVRFSVRMLHLHERCARKVVLEVTETDLVVVLLDLVGIDKREVVGQAAVEADLGARLGIKARVADVFDVALSAHEVGVRLVHIGDLAGESANAHILHI